MVAADEPDSGSWHATCGCGRPVCATPIRPPCPNGARRLAQKDELKGPDFWRDCRYNESEELYQGTETHRTEKAGSKETATIMSRLLQFVSETLSRRTRGGSPRPDMMHSAPLEDHDPLGSYMKVLEDARRSRWARAPRV